ncbi:protein SON isoform X2 [Poecilia reticulata]|uniref:protein SON isoform X2 n=1 Tax=Poecilia reticulata TaxID=8081 RepID=UPI0004A2E34B|nr:PREDICTED: protein SON-like isoform X2 [Poecilia reticulata]
MAANIEQIFQDFILNKIREIEEQKEDKSEATGADCEGKVSDAAKRSPPRDQDQDPSKSQKKQKKHKKHKSKKKRKNHEKESSSESGADMEGQEPRKETPGPEMKEQGDKKSSSNREHSSGKKKKRKKKKKRRRSGENTSDSDSEVTSKQKVNECLRPRQDQLPDIIPKQDSSNKGNGNEKRAGSRSPCPPSHSNSESHSCSMKSNPTSSLGLHCQRSQTQSPSPSKCHQSESSPSETTRHLCESVLNAQCPSERPPSPVKNLSSAQRPLLAEERAEPKTAEPAENRDKSEKESSGLSAHKPPTPSEPKQAPKSTAPQQKASEKPRSHDKSPARRKRKQSRSPDRDRDRKSSKKAKRSKSPSRSYRRRSRSRSRSVRKRSRSRSVHRRSRRSRSRSASRNRRRLTYSQRDRWKREPSHSPVLILRKKRSPTRKDRSRSTSPKRISELDKEQLLEIAKANAAAMCVKAGMPVPASLRTTVLPLALPNMAMNAAMASMTAASVTAALSNMGTLSSLLPLSSVGNKPSILGIQANSAALEEVKKKVAKQANSISIKEFTDKCKMIADSTGELPVALPHVSDEEDDGKLFGGSTIREQKVINFNINNTTVRPTSRSDAEMAKEFPVSSGSQHRKKEGEGVVAYGEWVPVEKTADKSTSTGKKSVSIAPPATPALPSGEAASDSGLPDVMEQQVAPEPDNDSVFPEIRQQNVDITQAVTERIKAQRRLAENPYDISAICMLSRAQEQVDAWAQSSNVPGLFTGSTGAQVLSSEELSTSGPQAWLKKDQFLRAAPVSGGVGEFLMRKMGWRTGEGLGRNREGTVEPIVIDFKVDRKGLVAEGEKPQKQTGGLVVTKDLMGKHPVSALIELCNKKRITQPEFVMVHHSGPDHRKSFLFKVTVNGVDYQPQTASPNKKHAKAMAATVALQALGEVPADGPGLYTGPVFTAASTGPLFST